MRTITAMAAMALGSYIVEDFHELFGSGYQDIAERVGSLARGTIECLGRSDALYHNLEHTMMVTLVGRDILRGRMMCERIEPEDYSHLIVACLLHDIGYVRGVLTGDSPDGYVIDARGGKARLPRGSSDAALTSHHVDRSKLFALDRLAHMEFIDASRVARAIEFTRFPSAIDPATQDSEEEGSLVRAADLIGQLGDPHYLRKANALYYEFEEVGMNKQLGYNSPADLTDLYPQFYYNSVAPHLHTAIRYLNVTSSGRQWIASLYSNVFRAESEMNLSGPER